MSEKGQPGSSHPAERIQKILSGAGIASRRKAEDLVREGRVTVNGRVASIGEVVAPDCDIRVDGQPISQRAFRYLALNKPPGYVTSVSSTRGEPTIMDLLPPGDRLFPVGRLDKDTHGLLLLTNDGEWANLIAHPRYGIEKEYSVLLRGQLSGKALQDLRRGAVVEGTHVIPRSVMPDRMQGQNTWVRMVLGEGRKREIRVLATEAGHPVLYLERVRIGHVLLGHLPEGRYRELSKAEVEQFRERGDTSGAGRASALGAPPGGDRRTGRSRQIDRRPETGRTTAPPSPRHRSHVPRGKPPRSPREGRS